MLVLSKISVHLVSLGILYGLFYTQNEEKIQLGDSAICFKSREQKPATMLFFNMHQNEKTSLKAAWEMVDSLGGKVFWLEGNKTRLVEFYHKRKKYKFDPNRIFSEEGIKQTLSYYSKTSNAIIIEKVQDFGKTLLQKIGTKERIISLHNNWEGGFGIASFQEGGEEYSTTEAIYINTEKDPDNFFLVTEERVFYKLKEKAFNVVLLKKKPLKDDGSLSYYCLKNDIPYINVEAQHTHNTEQKEMLKALYAIFNTQQ